MNQEVREMQILGIFQDRVPVFGCTVQEFIIGAIAIVVVAAIGFWLFDNFRGRG